MESSFINGGVRIGYCRCHPPRISIEVLHKCTQVYESKKELHKIGQRGLPYLLFHYMFIVASQVCLFDNGAHFFIFRVPMGHRLAKMC